MRIDERLPYLGAETRIVLLDSTDVIATSGEIENADIPEGTQKNPMGWTNV